LRSRFLNSGLSGSCRPCDPQALVAMARNNIQLNIEIDLTVRTGLILSVNILFSPELIGLISSIYG
jgi:hypothetical protein